MRNAQVVVYRRPPIYGGGPRIYACYRKTGRTTYLSDRENDYESTSLTKIRLAGRFVAFDASFGCRNNGDCSGRVEVVDVRRGKQTQTLIVEDAFLAGEEESQRPHLTDLALLSTGAAALIIGPTEHKELEVWNLRADGERTRLDHGTDVEAGSLAMTPRWIYWRRGGQPFAERTE